MSMLLFVDLMTRLNQVNVIVGIVLAVVGLALAFLAKRITRVFRHSDEIADNDKLFITIKAIGLVLVLGGLIATVVK